MEFSYKNLMECFALKLLAHHSAKMIKTLMKLDIRAMVSHM